MATGTATLDFGAFPGKCDASVAVTGQAALVAGSKVEAWIEPAATAQHSVDEHMLESFKVFAADKVAGTGFTIHGRSTWVGPGTNAHCIYGQWNIAWAWV